MEHEFAVGDVVQLKSGGPKMTIAEIGDFGMGYGDSETKARCLWFEGTKQREALFVPQTLSKVEQ
jgi:uncharacterized protein YodC (DUF2158 family)